jgi:hypothetical protein
MTASVKRSKFSRRTIVSHKHMTEVWTQLAHKKAEMYDGLAQECSKAYEVARKAAGSINAGVKQWDRIRTWLRLFGVNSTVVSSDCLGSD